MILSCTPASSLPVITEQDNDIYMFTRMEEARLQQNDALTEEAAKDASLLCPGQLPRRDDLTLDAPRVLLRPVRPDEDLHELYSAGHPPGMNLWYYVPRGPFKELKEFEEWLMYLTGDETMGLTIIDKATGEKVGMVNFMSIVPEHRRIELGGLWLTPKYHRTYVNTETCYLIIKHTFEQLRYRRLEWKCDASNEQSKAAATRLGFVFEGVFRKHMVIKGRNRDTAYFSITDEEWPAVKARLEKFIYSDYYEKKHQEKNAHNLTEAQKD